MKDWLENKNSAQPFITLGKYKQLDKLTEVQYTKSTEDVRVPTSLLPLGVLFVGMPGSGKTFGMKKLIEETAMLTSMKHLVVFDVKGDFVQLLRPNPERTDGSSKSFDAQCDVRVYTFGTDYGFPATLNPFGELDESYLPVGYDKDSKQWKTRDAKFKFGEAVRLLVKDTLTAVGLIRTDFSSGGEVLANNGLPAFSTMKTTGAVESGAAHKALAADLMSIGYQTCMQFFEQKEKLPNSFEEFAKALEEAEGKEAEVEATPITAPPVAAAPIAAAAVAASPIATAALAAAAKGGGISLPANLSQADLYFVAKQIRADVNGPWSTIYAPVRGQEGDTPPGQGGQDVYPLIASTLCDDGDKRHGKRVKISIIALFNLGDDLMKQRVVQTCLERIDRWVPGSGGSQDAPRTAIVIDEAHLAMPNPGGGFGKGKGEGASGVVQRILQLKRSNGIITILGTQYVLHAGLAPHPTPVVQATLTPPLLLFHPEQVSNGAE